MSNLGRAARVLGRQERRRAERERRVEREPLEDPCSKTRHAQVRIQPEGHEPLEVGSGLAPLISKLWKLGYRTTGSCEEQEGTWWPSDMSPAAWIGFGSEEQAQTFLVYLEEGTILRPNAEELENADPDDPALHGVVAVAFRQTRF